MTSRTHTKIIALAFLMYILVGGFLCLIPAGLAHAGTQSAAYVPISPITTPNNGSLYGNQSFSSFLQAIYTIGIAATFALGVVMVTIAGFKYIATEKIFAKGEARKNIENALIGIVIALSSVILLGAINSQLTNFSDLCLTSPDGSVPQSCMGQTSSSGSGTSNTSNSNATTQPTTPTTQPTTQPATQSTATLSQTEQAVTAALQSLPSGAGANPNISNDQAIQYLVSQYHLSYSDLVNESQQDLGISIVNAKQDISDQNTATAPATPQTSTTATHS